MLMDLLNKIYSDPAYKNMADSFLQEKYAKDYALMKYHLQGDLSILCWKMDAEGISVYVDAYTMQKPLRLRFPIVDGLVTGEHMHNYVEMAYIVSGTLHQRIDGKQIYFQQGEICFIDQNTWHLDYLHTADATILFMNLSIDLFRRLTQHDSGSHVLSYLRGLILKKTENYRYIRLTPKQNNKDIEAQMETILSEITAKLPGGEHILQGSIIRLFSYLPDQYHFYLDRKEKTQMRTAIFRDIEEYMGTHCNALSVTQVSNAFHYNEDYLNRLIKKESGMTFHELRQKIRLEKAAELLRSQSVSVENAAAAAGFVNYTHFYKIFREKYGMTPGAYKHFIMRQEQSV